MKKYRKYLFVILAVLLVILLISAQKPNPYKIFIDVEGAKLYLFKDGELYKAYPCAGGKNSTPSPIGTWKIVQKDTWGEGFGGRWMGLNCPWGKFGIHGTVYPNSIGWSSSKGCIRMFNKDVAELYSIVPYGTTVIIEDGCFGEFGRGLRPLRPGMYGSDVMAVQKKLAEMGYFNGHVNGRYDSALQTAVYKYQRANKMYETNTISIEMLSSLGFFMME